MCVWAVQVDPWGKWQVIARNKEYEAMLEATCDSSGTPLRAPTPKDGFSPICRDSFNGKVSLEGVYLISTLRSPVVKTVAYASLGQVYMHG